jgi:hypothetical protein
MPRTSHFLFALFASLTFFTGRARADVVAPPPSGMCPDGTTPQDSHGLSPASCTPNECTSDATCTDGTVCAEQKFCSVGGGWVVSTCPNGTECTNNSDCTPFKVCLKEPPAPPANDPTETGGCSCDLVSPTGSDTWLGLAAALGLTAALRSRRRRRSCC